MTESLHDSRVVPPAPKSRTARNLGWLFATAAVAVFAVGFQLNLPPGEQKDGEPPAAGDRVAPVGAEATVPPSTDTPEPADPAEPTEQPAEPGDTANGDGGEPEALRDDGREEGGNEQTGKPGESK